MDKTTRRSLKRVRVNITIDPDVYARARADAAEEDRNFSSQVNRILRDYYVEKDGKPIAGFASGQRAAA